MSTEDDYSSTDKEKCESAGEDAITENPSCLPSDSSNCESSPEELGAKELAVPLQFPELPVSAKQASRIKLYGRAPNPSMTLNGVEYVLQRRRRPRYRTDLLHEDTFVIVRMQRSCGPKDYINAIARVPVKLSVPILNESFDIDAYLSSTCVTLEVFDVKRHSNDNTILGRTLLYPRSEQTTFHLSDVIGFAEVFRPRGADLVTHGVVPGSQACLELACTEACPSRVVPAKMWRRVKLVVMKSTLGLSTFPLAPLFLLSPELLKKACSDRVENIEEVQSWMDTSRTHLLSLASLPLFSNSVADISQRVLSASLAGADAICQLLDSLWKHCTSFPAILSELSIDVFSALLRAFLRQNTPICDALEQMKTMSNWCTTFSFKLRNIDSTKALTKWIGRTFVKQLLPCHIDSRGVTIPTWSRACALEPSISTELLDAIYHLEVELFKSQSVCSEPDYTSHPANHMQGVTQLLDPVFKTWLQSFDDAVHAGNYGYVFFVVSQGKTKDSNLFAPLGLVSLSKTLLFSSIDFEVTQKMILQTPSAILKYVNTAPIDWVILSGNKDILTGFLSTCLENSESSIDLVQKTYEFALSGGVRTLRDIPQQLMPTLTLPYAIALIMGSMAFGDADQLLVLLKSLRTCVFEPATENVSPFPLFNITKTFINRLLVLDDSSTCGFSAPESLRVVLMELVSPPIYLLFSTSDQVNLLSAIIDSQIDQDFIVVMLTTLSSRASVLHCSESECLLEHAIRSGKLNIAACLLYDLFVDPTKHMNSWLTSLGCYSDDVIIHFIDSLLLRTTLAECDSAITAIYENTYSVLIRQKRFDSLRAINSHIKDLVSSDAFLGYEQARSADEDIIKLYLFATMAPSGKILISDRTVDDILTLVDIFGPQSLASADVLFQLGSFGLDELLEELLGSEFALSSEQLLNIFTDIINRVASILPSLLTIFLRFLDYALSPLTDKETKDGATRPFLDFLNHPNTLVLYLLAVENSVTLIHEHLEGQLRSSGLSWDKITGMLTGEDGHQTKGNGLICLGIVQSILTSALSEYNTKLNHARGFAKLACTQMTSSNLSAMVSHLEFLLLQRAVRNAFTNNPTIFTLNFMSAPTILSSSQFICPFSMTILATLNLCVSECEQLTCLGAYPVHLVPKEILQRVLQVKGICALCHLPFKSVTHASGNTDIMDLPIIRSYYRFLNTLNSEEPPSVTSLPIVPKRSVCEQIDSLTDAYLAAKADKTHKEKDNSPPAMLSAQFLDGDLLSAPKREPVFRGDTILHTIFSLFDFGALNDISESLASTLSDTLASIITEYHGPFFSHTNASYKTPLQMINITSLDQALLVLTVVKRVDPALLSPYVDASADYPSLVHCFLFKLITNSSEYVLSQTLPLVPKAIMRDFLLAPCYSLSNSILLTALLRQGVGDLDFLISVYQQYGCLNEAAVMPDCGGWCAVTVALQNPDILEVPSALFEAAMKSPKKLLVNKYGHTPLHCLFFNGSLVSQTPHKDKGQYVYSYHVLSDTKIDPVFKLSMAQQLTETSTSNDAISQLDRFGMTPLHYAVMSSAFVCMESLLGKYSSIQLLDKAGLDRDVTPLELALARKSEPMVQLLLQKGANPLRRTSATSFLGEPLTVFARLIQNGYLNLAYTVIYQHSSMRSLLLNEALHANTTNSKPVLRALTDGTTEACIAYLALSISGQSVDKQIMKAIMDLLQGIYAGAGKKFHMTTWLGSFVFSSPSYWFSGDDSLYNSFVKLAAVTNFAENNLAFNLRLITSNIPVKLICNGLRVRHLVSSSKASGDFGDDSALIEKASPVELMLLKLYHTSCQNVFAEKEFLMLLQLYVCKSLHISPLISRIVLDFLTATQTGTLTRANVQFCNQFFKSLSAMLIVDECLVPSLAVKTLRTHAKEFIVKLLGTDEILTKLFTVLTLPPPTKPNSGRCHSIILGSSMNSDGHFMEDYTPCCLEILKCYVATNSVVWPSFFSAIYGLHSEMHRNPKQVITHVFDQLNSVNQVSKPTMETLFSAATTSLASLYSRGCAESVVAGYLSDLLEAAKQKQLYDEMLTQILNKVQSIKVSTNNEAPASYDLIPDLDTETLEHEFTETTTHIEKLLNAPVNRTLRSTELTVPSIVLGYSQEPVKVTEQVFHSIPSQVSSVFYQDGSSLRVDGHSCHFMLVNVLLRRNSLLLAFHSYSLRFNQCTNSYALFYKSRRSIAELKGGCYSWQGIAGYWPEKELFKYATVDQAIKSFHSYFKKKSGLSFTDCCTNGLSQAYYESAGTMKGMVCYVGKDVIGITTKFLEITPAIKNFLPNLFLYGVTSIIAAKIDSVIVSKLPASDSKDWRAMKIISSIVLSALSTSLVRDETYYYEDPGFDCTILSLKRALSAYEETILPILDSPGFLKTVKAAEDCVNMSEASRESILRVCGMGLYMHELSGLPMHLLPMFIICSRLPLYYLKMYFSNIKLALDGVHRGSLLLLASLHSFAESPSNMSVKTAVTLVDRVLGVKLQTLDRQTSFLLQTLSDLPKRTVICRIYGWNNSDAITNLINHTREFIVELSKGRSQCPESWINRRECPENNESKSKVDWSDANLLWVSSESATNGLATLVSGIVRPSRYDQWAPCNYGFNFDTTPLYGISTSPLISSGAYLRFGVIAANVSSFLVVPQQINPDVMKVAPGVLWSQGRNGPIQEYVAAGFKYNWLDQRVTAVSFTPEDMHIQYVAFL
ncbi:Hypothetical protein GLP15_977 [Giardia lamblia P15]|uniref:Uncharacterized protein n=1 Tax=Giardia intestinalis (strain P15) TaxID=658858 RepID=E1EZ55_GIAIA|nr:Hypothetical protein GLP15_977 [Giardia lamblia P15]